MIRQSQPNQIVSLDQPAQQTVLKKTMSAASIKQWTAGIPEHPIPHHREQRNLYKVIFIKVHVSRIASFTYLEFEFNSVFELDNI